MSPISDDVAHVADCCELAGDLHRVAGPGRQPRFGEGDVELIEEAFLANKRMAIGVASRAIGHQQADCGGAAVPAELLQPEHRGAGADARAVGVAHLANERTSA